MKKINIAIDGPSAAGKSTIAKLLAKKLNYVYIDTGAMYRCVAYYCLNNKIAFDDEEKISSSIKDIHIKMDNNGKVYLNNEDVSNKIRADEISLGASAVAKLECVRTFLVAAQREMAKDKGVILDGRDIGTVVLPDAELKIYQIASVECRAKRRYEDNIQRGLPANLEEISKDIQQRDYQDMHREISPLKKANDAIEVDTSNMTIEENVDHMMKLVKEKEN
ncbi:MAG: (d)CMP kinase [Thomasclavelia sp.]|jgi:cytidylate kinase|nr:(d)CMP kinase [Thomasclavelia sp.]